MTATQPCSSAICLLSLALAATTPAAGSSDKAPRLTGEASGDSFAATEHGPHLTDEQRRFIENEIVRNVARLRAEGRMPLQIETVLPLAWPFAPWNGLAGFGHHGVSNFVDQDPAYPGAVLDYQCGSRTYDQSSGYNHRGTDIFTWPFGWLRMDSFQVAGVAAAPGVITYKDDGHTDRSCAFSSDPPNMVVVTHADGSYAWYLHFKNGSLTPKGVGEPVAQGEYLGTVGSSGSSTGPHLHFEVYDSSGVLVDPYAGPCNSLNASSLWIAQRPYFDSAVNRMTTGLAPPVLQACPSPETPNEQIDFTPGNTIYFTTYYRDQLSSQQSHYYIYFPDGTLALDWTHNSPAAHCAASYWWWGITFPVGVDEGTYRFEVAFQGTTRKQYFNVGSPSAAGRISNAVPLEASLEPDGDLTLDWGGSCAAADSDYAVYEGILGSYASHVPALCSTGGLTAASFTPGADSRYYIVVARTAFREGSHGVDSAGLERPRGPSACLPQAIATCP